MATSPVLFVYYPPSNDDSWPGVPGRHITEADWASFTIAQRRTIENATTQEGYTRRKVWVHIDLVDETEEERAQREAAEAAARAEYDRKNSLVRYGQIEAMIDQLEVLPPAEEFAALRQDVDAVADVPPRVEAVETALADAAPKAERADSRVFDVRAYGATGDGVTNDTAAIQAAIDDAYGSGVGGSVFFPQGVYIAEGLTLKHKVSLIGVMSEPFLERKDASLNTGSVLKLKAGATQPLVISDSVNSPVRASSVVGPGSQRYQISTIENLGFHGNRDTQSSVNADLLRLVQSWSVVIKNCYFQNSKGFGLRALDCNALEIRHNTFLGAPVFFESVADTVFHDNQMGGHHGVIGPVLWLAGMGELCWSNLIHDNFIYNNQPGFSRTITADPATDTITTATAHGLSDGTPVIFTVSSGGARPGGIFAGRAYYVKVLSTTTVKIATTRKNLDAGTFVDLTSEGSGTITMQGGENCNVYLNDPTFCKWNLFSGNRFDQAHGHNVVCDGAKDNVFEDNLNYGAGLNNTEGQAGYRFQNGATGNTVGGGLTDGTVYTSGGLPTNQTRGVWADSSSTGTVIRSGTHIRNHSVSNISIPDAAQEFLSLPTATFEPMAGSPVVGGIASSRRNGWLLDGAADEAIGTEFWVPAEWTSITVKVAWTNAGSGSGDIVLALNMDAFATGANLNIADTHNPTLTVTAPAQNVLTETTFPSFAVMPGRMVFLRVKREASNAVDTLPNDMAVIAVRVERAAA